MDRRYQPLDQDLVQPAVDATTTTSDWGAGLNPLAWAQGLGGGGNEFAKSLIGQSAPSLVQGPETVGQKVPGWELAGRFAGGVVGSVLGSAPGTAAGAWLGGELGKSVDAWLYGEDDEEAEQTSLIQPAPARQAPAEGAPVVATAETAAPQVEAPATSQTSAATASADTAATSAPTAGQGIQGMSQFIWYGFDVSELSYTEATAAIQIVHDVMGIGSGEGGNEAPDMKTESKLNGNKGYWWFDANDRPVFDGESGGVKYIKSTVARSETNNDWTSWLSYYGPGLRKGFVKKDGGRALFSWSENPEAGYEPIPAEAQHLNLRNIPGSTCCYATATSMIAQVGMTPTRTDDIHGIVTAETYENHMVVTTTEDPKAAQEAKDYIDFELSHGRPVFTGVTYKDSNGNAYLTDHWVIITGTVGEGQYSYDDPGTSSTAAATSDENVFVWDGTCLKSTCPGKGYVVSWIRPNASSLKEWNAFKAQQAATDTGTSTETGATGP